MYTAPEPSWSDWQNAKPANRDAMYRENVDRGARNAEEHTRRALAGESLYGCECLTCRHRREDGARRAATEMFTPATP